MLRKPIHRGEIVSAGYDSAARTLDVELTDRRVLRYREVPAGVAEKLIRGASPYSWWRDVICEEYQACELGPGALADVQKPKSKEPPAALKALFGD